jgi:hypothetical protein
VPPYSQEIHYGEYPEFDNGGEAWCSPTSTSMVLGYWDELFPDAGYAPSEDETSWVGFRDQWVGFTARYVYNYRDNGAGNWPFNTAYAAARGLVGAVTQLHNLREAEPFIKAGIPLASVAWSSNKLTGGIKSTNGHLSVIVGFTGDGKEVTVNDPASDTNAEVKHSYDREEYERGVDPGLGRHRVRDPASRLGDALVDGERLVDRVRPESQDGYEPSASDSGLATVPGSMRSCAAEIFSRFTIMLSNLNAAEASSSNSTGKSNTLS